MFFLLVHCILTMGAQSVEREVEKSAFCIDCSCEPDAEGGINVECNGVDVNVISRKSSWYDKMKNSYLVIRLKVQRSKFKDLNVKFPKSKLNSLDLSNNFIETIAAGVFGDLENLKVLDLSNNEIESLSSEIFKGYYRLEVLKKLVLANNKFPFISKDLFEHTPNLATLSLSGNPLKILGESTITAISSTIYLTELDLSYTLISDIPDKSLCNLKLLKTLNISGNQFEKVPRNINELQSLQTLLFNDNPISNLTRHNGFPDMKSLKILHMCNMPELESIGPHSLGNLSALEELHLTGNRQLEMIHPDALKKVDGDEPHFMSLRELDLQNNSLTHLDEATVYDWNGVDSIDLSYNPLSCNDKNNWILYVLVSRIELMRNKNVTRCTTLEDFMEDFSDHKSIRLSVTDVLLPIFLVVALGIIAIIALMDFICMKENYKRGNYNILPTNEC